MSSSHRNTAPALKGSLATSLPKFDPNSLILLRKQVCLVFPFKIGKGNNVVFSSAIKNIINGSTLGVLQLGNSVVFLFLAFTSLVSAIFVTSTITTEKLNRKNYLSWVDSGTLVLGPCMAIYKTQHLGNL